MVKKGIRFASTSAAEKAKKKLTDLKTASSSAGDMGGGSPHNFIYEGSSSPPSPTSVPASLHKKVSAEGAVLREIYNAADYLLDDVAGNEHVDDGSSIPSSSVSKQYLDNTTPDAKLTQNIQSPSCSQGVQENASSSKQASPSLLNSAPKSYFPGTVDFHMNIMNVSPRCSPPAEGMVQSLPPAEIFEMNSSLPAASNVRTASFSSKKPSVSANENEVEKFDMQKPGAWEWKDPISFDGVSEQESYKRNGVVNLNEEEAARIKLNFANALVGRVVGKIFPFHWLASQLHAKWGSLESFKLKDIGVGCFLISFASRSIRDKVWLGGPWHVAGNAVVLDRWSEKFIPSLNPDMMVPTWVRLPGLPMHFWGKINLKRIAAEIGEPICVDAKTLSQERACYARVCVRRNPSTPIIGGIRLCSKATGEFFQKIMYEGIASCFACGLSGHSASACKANNAEPAASIDVTNPELRLERWTAVPRRHPPKQKRGSIAVPEGRNIKQNTGHTGIEINVSKFANFPMEVCKQEQEISPITSPSEPEGSETGQDVRV